jgi:hypothetical protein
MEGKVKNSVAHRDSLAKEFVHCAGVVIKHHSSALDLLARARYSLAAVLHLELCDNLGLASDTICHPLQDAASLVGRRFRPWPLVERPARRCYGTLDIIATSFSHRC